MPSQLARVRQFVIERHYFSDENNKVPRQILKCVDTVRLAKTPDIRFPQIPGPLPPC